MATKVNSDRALEIGRRLFERYGRDWTQVYDAGERRADGVVEIRGEVGRPGKSAGPASPGSRARQAR